MSEKSFDVVYLTGTPASGKSTLLDALARKVSPVIPFSYSKALTRHVELRRGTPLSELEIRAKSAQLVTPEDVTAVDKALLALVTDKRRESHIVIDSHAVTKERYGLRVTPFNRTTLHAIAPTVIVCLYTPPEVAIERIRQHPEGRPVPTSFDANLHTHLQCSVALAYAIDLGIPAYFVDSTRPVEVLVDEVRNRLKATS